MTQHSDEYDQPAHAPIIYRTGRYGCWGGCVCGWSSSTWTTVTGVHGEFGEHLVQSSGNNTPPGTQSDYLLDGSSESVAVVREARGLPPVSDGGGDDA